LRLGKPTKNQLLRENIAVSVKQSKQSTFDGLSTFTQNRSAGVVDLKDKKQIFITEIETVTKEEELELKVGFRLSPSKTSFSKVTSDLYFDGQKFNSTLVRILQSPLFNEENQFKSVLEMNGICAGLHTLKVEMYELWIDGEKLSCVSKEIEFEYVPIKREGRFIKIPTVKSVVGADLEVISECEKNIYRELDEDEKNEQIGKRDGW
jgi:hypothetical protein